jgi:hypothetical protein
MLLSLSPWPDLGLRHSTFLTVLQSMTVLTRCTHLSLKARLYKGLRVREVSV